MTKSLLFTILCCGILSVSIGQQKSAPAKTPAKSHMVTAKKRKMHEQEIIAKKSSIAAHDDKFANKKSFNQVDVLAQKRAASKTSASKN